MTIDRKKLLDNLKLVMSGIETGNATIQGADTFVFHNGNIFSYNDIISVCVPIENTGLIEETLEGAVKAQEFYNVVSKLPSDEITFTVGEDNKCWNIKCGKAKATLNLIDFDYVNRLKGIEPTEEWIPLHDEFVGGLTVCKMDGNKTPLAGLYVDGDTIVSTDGMQMNKFVMKETKLPKFWITDSSANELLKIKLLKEMQVQDSWVHFRTEDNTMFSIKTMMCDKYPIEKIKKVLDVSSPKEDDFHATFPKDLFNSIDRACSFSLTISERSAVRLNIKPECISVSSERSTGNYAEDVAWEAPIEKAFTPMTVYVDAGMMNYVASRTLEFYLIKGPLRDGKQIPRLLFVTDQSVHLMSTLDIDN